MSIFQTANLFYNATRQGVASARSRVLSQATDSQPGVVLRGPWSPDYAPVLTPEAIAFVAKLTRTFGERREALLARRQERQAAFNRGHRPHFLPETKAIREGDWKVAPLPKDLLDRRVEITGPVERKMIINALNSGANVFMADFEDANSPTWENVARGQLNLMDAVRRTISFDAENGKHYALNEKTAVLFVRPRGWHLPERHLEVDGKPVPGAFFDFGLFFFHNAKEQLARGTGPYFYLPKMESHLEGPALERRVPAGPAGAGHPARHHQGHRAHRDAARGVRDARDPLRAA